MNEKPIVILGGGISGLSLAWYLSKDSGRKIILLEKSSRLGGYIETSLEKGFLFEQGPRTFKPSRSRAILELIDELGLSGKIIASKKESARRFIYSNKKLLSLPNHLFGFLASPLTRGVVPAALREWFVPANTLDDETIYDFVSRRFNSKIANRLFDPMTLGIYAGDIHHLSIKSCFPILHQLEQENGAVSKGLLRMLRNQARKDPFARYGFEKSSLFSLKDGMQLLVDTLQEKLQIQIEVNTEVKALKLNPNSVSVITTEKEIEADQVYSALPPRVLGDLLHPIDAHAFSYLQQIKTASLFVVSCGFSSHLLPIEGFGYLVPSSEDELVMGAVFDSCIYPAQNRGNQTRISFMLGGAQRPQIEAITEKEAIEVALNALQRHLKIPHQPEYVKVLQAKHSIPQFHVGHSKKIATIEKNLQHLCPRIHFTGNFIDGVSVNACIERSKQLATQSVLTS